MPYYNTCPECGANLDPGEKCDCRSSGEPIALKIPVLKNPCKDCSDRYPCCHAKCDDYTAWKQAHDRARAKEQLCRETQRSCYNKHYRR